MRLSNDNNSHVLFKSDLTRKCNQVFSLWFHNKCYTKHSVFYLSELCRHRAGLTTTTVVKNPGNMRACIMKAKFWLCSWAPSNRETMAFKKYGYKKLWRNSLQTRVRVVMVESDQSLGSLQNQCVSLDASFQKNKNKNEKPA